MSHTLNSGSLDLTAKTYLNKKKSDYGVSNADIDITDILKIPDNILIKRCMTDAMLTGELGSYLDGLMTQVSDDMGTGKIFFNYSSKASLSEALVKALIPKKHLRPYEIPKSFYKQYPKNYNKSLTYAWEEAQFYANRAYKGGIFQLRAKGYFKNLDYIDINSAYPNIMRSLLTIDHTHCRKVSGYDLYRRLSGIDKIITFEDVLLDSYISPVIKSWNLTETYFNYEDKDGFTYIADKRMFKDVLYGFYHVKMQFNGYSAYRMFDDNLIYPVTDDLYEDYITKDELVYLLKHNAKMQIIDGIEICPNRDYEKIPVFKDFINVLYDLKKKYKATDLGKYILIKIIMNSLYGKTAQSKYGMGSLTNFIYASVISARVRIKIMHDAEKYFSKIVEIATDSITGYLNKSGKKHYSINDNLGQFSIETGKKAPDKVILLASGLAIIPDNSKEITLTKTRGFNMQVTDQFGRTVRGHVTQSKNRKSLNISYTKVLHSREAIIQGKTEDIDTFRKNTKKIALNDDKRSWPHDFTYDMLKTGNYYSEALSDLFLKEYDRDMVISGYDNREYSLWIPIEDREIEVKIPIFKDFELPLPRYFPGMNYQEDKPRKVRTQKTKTKSPRHEEYKKQYLKKTGKQ